MDKYQQIVEKISTSAGLTTEEIDRKVEAKRAKLSGLISKEGAAQIVAAELGVSFDNQKVKINELVEGTRRARIIGKITKIMPTRSYEKNGRSGKIGSFHIGDDSSNIRVVLWDTNHIAMIDNNELKEGQVMEISNASVKNAELHLSAFSDLKKSSEKIGEVKEGQVFLLGAFKDAKAGVGTKIRANIVQLFDPKYFDGKSGEKRALVNFVLDDGTETMRAVVGPEQITQAGVSKEELFDLEKFALAKNSLMGEEFFFTGNYRMNTYFNKIEFSISGIEKVNTEILLKELEEKNIL